MKMTRIYNNWHEAIREVERDLYEMGTKVHPPTMQDKDVKDDEDYSTMELVGYDFRVTDPSRGLREAIEYVGLNPDQILKYIELEVQDRIYEPAVNPGSSYKVRPEIWEEFLHGGQFSYTYSERLWDQREAVKRELNRRLDSRQLIMSMWNPSVDPYRVGGVARIPCSMYYQLIHREGKLNMIYTMRSSDVLTHWIVDMGCAYGMLVEMCKAWNDPTQPECNTTFEPGYVHVFHGSLHAYKKDMDKRGIF